MIITYKRLFYIMLFYYFVNNYIKTSNLLRYIRNSESVSSFINLIDISKKNNDNKPRLTRTKSEKEILLTGDPVITSSDEESSPNLDPELQIVDN
jgi:hypothetical protein